MRKSLLIPTLILLNTSLCATIIGLPFRAEQFADDTYVIYINDWMELVDPEPKGSQHYDYALREKNGKYEVRYTLFKQVEEAIIVKQQFAMWTQMVAFNIGGSEEAVLDIYPFNDSDVQAEFNGDFGYTFIISPEYSDFTNEYKIIIANFYYKKDLGIMCQTILFNDMSVYQTEDFFSILHSFKFN